MGASKEKMVAVWSPDGINSSPKVSRDPLRLPSYRRYHSNFPGNRLVPRPNPVGYKRSVRRVAWSAAPSYEQLGLALAAQ